MQPYTNEARLATERMVQLESEIETRRAEISQLQITARGQANHDVEQDRDEYSKPLKKSASLHQSLDELILLWEHRLTTHRSEDKTPLQTKRSTSAIDDGDALYSSDIDISGPPDLIYTTSSESDGPPDLVYTTSSDSDETRDPPSSPKTTVLAHFLQPFGSSRRKKIEPQPPVSETTKEERDQKIEWLEGVISSDTEIIKKMKDTMERMVCELEETESNATFLQMIAEELESTIAMQSKQNGTIKNECARLQSSIKHLEDHSSAQENAIEFLKAEMVNLLVAKQLVEKHLNKDLERRGAMISDLEWLCKDKEHRSQSVIKDLKVRNSSLEDEIENLKAENVRLQVGSQILEEESRLAEEALKIELQLCHIENSYHDIL